MQAPDTDIDEQGLPLAEPGCGHPVWSDLSTRLNRLSALANVQAHAVGVPALATLLMQGLVL